MKLVAIGLRQLNSRRERAKMIRSLATAMSFGALVGAAVFWAAVQWRQHPLVVWIGARDQAGQAFPVGETLPLCTAMGSLATDVDWAPLDPDFAAGKKALAAEDWNAAIAALKLAALREPDNADVQNYIGYAYRRLRQMEQAFTHYDKAVALNPRHRSAHQHLGEAFLIKGKISKAEEHLAALERICLIPCEEYGDLKRAIADYQRTVIH
jgi:tetratricopeptide (TPR) repeat protein